MAARSGILKCGDLARRVAQRARGRGTSGRAAASWVPAPPARITRPHPAARRSRRVEERTRAGSRLRTLRPASHPRQRPPGHSSSAPSAAAFPQQLICQLVTNQRPAGWPLAIRFAASPGELGQRKAAVVSGAAGVLGVKIAVGVEPQTMTRRWPRCRPATRLATWCSLPTARSPGGRGSPGHRPRGHLGIERGALSRWPRTRRPVPAGCRAGQAIVSTAGRAGSCGAASSRRWGTRTTSRQARGTAGRCHAGAAFRRCSTRARSWCSSVAPALRCWRSAARAAAVSPPASASSSSR
jgi:hypothetical protein